MKIITLPTQHDVGRAAKHIAVNCDEIHRVEESPAGKVTIVCKQGDRYNVPDDVSFLVIVEFLHDDTRTALTCHSLPWSVK